jgi:LysR family transcriptional regulator, regulator for bpeEF and oprC
MDKLRALRFFCRIAETRSFAAAAYDLDVVPSVLSKTIATLESDIHFKLFNRTTRRVSLTENGARYYDHSKRLLLELDEAELLVREGVAKPVGKVVVGLHPSINRLLMSHIGEFLAAYPYMVVETTIASTPGTLLDDKLDVLFTVSELPDSTFGVQIVGATRHILAASPTYLKARGIPKSPEDLRDHMFIVSGRPDGPSYARWTLKRGSRVDTVLAPARLTNRQGVHIYEACLAGAGITRFVEIHILPDIRRGEIAVVLPEWSLGSLPIRAVVPDRRNVPTRVRVLIDFLRTIIKRTSRQDGGGKSIGGA